MNSDFFQTMSTHVVDILGNVRGRDQPIMLMSKAAEFISKLGNRILSSDEYVYFDPFCKAGEILLAAAFSRCLSKFEIESELNINDVYNDMFKGNRYYALAPDERHFRLSLRTFLGNEKSHDESHAKIFRNGDYLSEKDGRFNEEKFKKELRLMIEYIKSESKNRKIVAVGNPPYQEADGGAQASAKPIYHLFVETLIDSQEIDELMLVIPSRWFAGGKGLDNFRSRMIESKNIRSITHFSKTGDVFPTVDIDGGICFLHWSKSYDGKPEFISEDVKIELDLSNFDIIPDDPKSYTIIGKIRDKWKKTWVSDVAWARKPFGLATDYFKKNSTLRKSDDDAIPCLGRERTIFYVSRNEIQKNKEFIDDWKVCIPGAYGGKKGDRRMTLPAKHIFLVPKGTITTETYMVINSYKNKQEAESLINYLQTDFCRYLLGLRKINQHIPRERWQWVPLMDIGRQWTDDDLFKYFDLSSEEKEHIKKKVQEWS